MKIRGKDGVVRRFKVSVPNVLTGHFDESCCLECGKTFEVHDTSFLKSLFKLHTCRKREVDAARDP